jgi:EAL domain-containing protein (putative c-di-GMP-specific phosphodiesterase class I)
MSCAVNLSLAQVQQKSQVERIVEIIRESGVEPWQIEIELTETAAPSNPDEVSERLKPILDLGIRLALDDLGTGYATLSLLRRLPVTKVKIDRSFMTCLGEGSDGVEDLRAIVEMGQGLGLTVLAEGVEREDQYDTLRRLGCDSYQGYYFSPALPAAEMTALIGRSDLG